MTTYGPKVQTIELPGGDTAVIREKITVGERKRLTKAMMSMGSDEDEGVEESRERMVDKFGSLNALAASIYMVSWTVTDEAGEPIELPLSEETIDGLDEDIWDPIGDLIMPRISAAIQRITKGFTFEAATDPKAPTGSSSSSNGSASTAQPPELTVLRPAPSADTAATSTEPISQD